MALNNWGSSVQPFSAVRDDSPHRHLSGWIVQRSISVFQTTHWMIRKKSYENLILFMYITIQLGTPSTNLELHSFLKGYWEVFCFVDLYRLAMSNFCWDIYFLWLIETRPRLPNWVRSLVTSSQDLQLSVTLRFSQLQAIKLLGIKYKYGVWKKNCKVWVSSYLS